jgi:hypothetical protein
VEKVNLYLVVTRLLQFQKLFGDLLGRAEGMHVSPYDALVALMAAPGGLIAAGHRTHGSVDRSDILGCDDGAASLFDFAFGLAADDMWVDDGANGTAPCGGEVADVLGMRREGRQCIADIGAGRTGDENK